MGMNCVLLAPTGMGLEVLAPMGRDPDQHPPRQPQAPERKAADADAPPNGEAQPQLEEKMIDNWEGVQPFPTRKIAPIQLSAAARVGRRRHIKV
jgi:hypothetical protein